MQMLRDILNNVQVLQTVGETNLQVASLCIDSRKAAPGAAFKAVSGTVVDGHEYIAKAIEQGANVIVIE